VTLNGSGCGTEKIPKMSSRIESRPPSRNNITCNTCTSGSWHHSLVGITTGYGLDARMIGVRFPARAGYFSFQHHVQTDSGSHPPSYLMGTRGSFTGGRAAGA
jgi:hypothetical protein